MHQTKTKLTLTEQLSSISIFLVLGLLLSTNNYTVAIAALTVFISIAYIIKQRNNIAWDLTDKLVIAVLSAYLVSNIPMTILDWGNFRYFRGASRIILCIPIYFFFKYFVDIRKIYVKSLSWGVFIGSIGAVSIAIYQFFIEGRPRVDGFLYSINFGYLACSIAVLSLALLRTKEYRFILFIAFSLSMSAMLMTLTRGAILALPALLIFAYVLNFKNIGIIPGIIGTVIIVLVFSGFYSFSPKFKHRVDYTTYEFNTILAGDTKRKTSAGGRIMLWKASFEAFKERPLTGLTHPERESLNKKLAKEKVINNWASNIPRGHAHSQYFDMLASGGLLGVTAIVFMLFIPFFYFLRNIRNSNAAYIGVLFVSSFIIFCFTEVALQQNLISTFYGYMLVLLFAATQAELKSKSYESKHAYS
ncbi:O-antigen ligase family protein [Vibrio coralliilyticus]|uniref:O-antigen ligase family protein n=1 Tax=Vibrio coralliilyticus TaxID=190893 RepID=UPI00155FE2D1|nr:O-antigen ligase family protein [Vibrio coralliilyticus]NRF27199.1 O-antigen ligase family protein [Vibrio coralliilyticus]NRF81469.1 O-antigen ligase family protein [Vibrio coralliilyticus]